jgi:hypothetical protein
VRSSRGAAVPPSASGGLLTSGGPVAERYPSAGYFAGIDKAGARAHRWGGPSGWGLPVPEYRPGAISGSSHDGGGFDGAYSRGRTAAAQPHRLPFPAHQTHVIRVGA